MSAADAGITFNYAELPAGDRRFLKDQTGAIRSLIQRAAQDVTDIGRRLLAVKARLPHGRFGEWLRAEFAMTDRTAQNFMTVARAFKSETVSDLAIAPKALYMLAAPSVPQDAREEAVDQARRGERVGQAEARRIIAEHSPAKPVPQIDVVIRSEPHAEPAKVPVTIYSAPEAEPTEPGKQKAKGKGIILAYEAVNSLTRIPQDDPHRKRGLQIVADWIGHHPDGPDPVRPEGLPEPPGDLDEVPSGKIGGNFDLGSKSPAEVVALLEKVSAVMASVSRLDLKQLKAGLADRHQRRWLHDVAQDVVRRAGNVCKRLVHNKP